MNISPRIALPFRGIFYYHIWNFSQDYFNRHKGGLFTSNNRITPPVNSLFLQLTPSRMQLSFSPIAYCMAMYILELDTADKE